MRERNQTERTEAEIAEDNRLRDQLSRMMDDVGYAQFYEITRCGGTSYYPTRLTRRNARKEKKEYER